MTLEFNDSDGDGRISRTEFAAASERGLQAALTRIAALEAQAKGNTSFLNMTATATLIAAAALLRQESRGAHCRRDFPATDPDQAHRSRLTLHEVMTLRQSLLEPAR
ncbi:hypothetical protein [Cypionkella sp.]|uniref:hypothetical protein n=1 Tax=Cypionkella sp. TaxID=2811411 RepID=UPI00351CC1DD